MERVTKSAPNGLALTALATSVGVLLHASLGFAQSTGAGAAPATDSTTSTTSNPTRDALTAAWNELKQTSTPPEWQDEVFLDEVIPNAERFMRGSSVDVERLKRFLSFHAKTSSQTADSRLVLYYRVDPECDRCKLIQSKVRPVIIGAIGRRGFRPVFLAADDIYEKGLEGRALDDRVWEEARRRNYAGALVAQFSKATQGSPGEIASRIVVRTNLMLRDQTQRSAAQTELAEDQAPESQVARNLFDAFLDFGSKTLVAQQIKEAQAKGEEIALVVQGVDQYADYQKLKVGLEGRLKEIGTLEERKFAKGRVIFGIRSPKSAVEIRTILAGTSLEAGLKLSFLPDRSGSADGRAIGSSESEDRTLVAEMTKKEQE